MIQLNKKDFGYVFEWGPFIGGFGNRYGTLEVLRKQYPRFQFFGVKQTHSDQAHIYHHEASDQYEADAIIGSVPDVIYYVKTADCIPLLLIENKTKSVACIHAGWKGVTSRIVPKTIQKILQLTRASSSSLSVIIGPHIQKPSFEVDEPVFELLKKSVSIWTSEMVEVQNSKFNVDLNLIVKLQLEEVGITAGQVNSLMIDTKCDLDFHSYRRDRDQSGRQISFIGRQA